MAKVTIDERVAVVEVSLENHIDMLKEHVRGCEAKHERNFRLQLVVLAGILAILTKMFVWPV